MTLKVYAQRVSLLPYTWTSEATGFETHHGQGDLFVVAESKAAAADLVSEVGGYVKTADLRLAQGNDLDPIRDAGHFDAPVVLFHNRAVDSKPLVRANPDRTLTIVGRWRYDRKAHRLVLDRATSRAAR